jgi:hypothetical protein
MAERKQLEDRALSNWLRDREAAVPSTVHIEKRRRLFEALNAVVSTHNSWIVSPPGDRRVRIETPPHSSLIIRLAEAGHKVRFVTTGTRNTGNGILAVDIFELTLPR